MGTTPHGREPGGDPPAASRVLLDYAHLLPAHGSALDLASGRGGNALWLAARGLEAWAWDRDAAALEELARCAREQGVAVRTEVRDCVARPPAAASFDVIVVSRFLDRTLTPALTVALRPDGLLFYQTFVRAAVDAAGPRNPDYRLDDNELLRLFYPALAVLAYRDEGRVGDVARGFRNHAMLVARRLPEPAGTD